MSDLNVCVRENVIRNPEGKIKYKKFSDGGREHYHLGVWLEGDERELEKIRSVEYELHPTFRNRIRESSNRKNAFSVTFWSWGMFEITVRAHLYTGQVEEFTHQLRYPLPDDDGTNYVQV